MMIHKYIAATLTIAMAIGPASAIDVGVGGNAGGVGVSAGASVGSNGASAGVGASAGGIGGVSGGVSAGSGGVSGSASAGAGGASGSASVGAGGGSGSSGGSASSQGGNGSSGGAGAGAGSASGGTSGASASGTSGAGGSARTGAIGATVIRPTTGVRDTIILPRLLRPSGPGRDRSNRSAVGYPSPPLLRAIPGTPSFVIRACRNAIVSAAVPLGAVRVRASSAGPVSRQRRGALTAPIRVRIDYARQSGLQVRQAKVRCRLDASGTVIAIL
jgi:hypothetical protein